VLNHIHTSISWVVGTSGLGSSTFSRPGIGPPPVGCVADGDAVLFQQPGQLPEAVWEPGHRQAIALGHFRTRTRSAASRVRAHSSGLRKVTLVLGLFCLRSRASVCAGHSEALRAQEVSERFIADATSHWSEDQAAAPHHGASH